MTRSEQNYLISEESQEVVCSNPLDLFSVIVLHRYKYYANAVHPDGKQSCSKPVE